MYLMKTVERHWIGDVTLVIGWSLLIGLCAKIAVPLPFTPIPIQTQSVLVFLGAICFGSKRGAMAAAAFVLQGILGLPVFAGGIGGAAIFLGPRGGYLVGYVAAAFLIGWILERHREKRLKDYILALLVGNAALFACGALYLATFVGCQKALLLGVAPFVLGDLLKIGVILKIVQWMRRFN